MKTNLTLVVPGMLIDRMRARAEVGLVDLQVTGVGLDCSGDLDATLKA